MNRSGFSLLEVMVVVAIMSLLLLALFTAFVTGQKTVSTGVNIANAVTTGEIVAANVVNDLAWAKVDPLTDGTTVTFQIPVEVDGSVLDGSDDVNWGSRNAKDEKLEYAYVPSPLAEHTANETADDRDYNRDGDKTDVFIRGTIVLREYDAAMNVKWEKPQTPTVILSGDMDNDGNDDPVFSQRVGAIVVDLWVYCEDDDGRPMARNISTSVVPMN
jgi:prepilin-type N-terminal cleavage/methylation domain-containing protein